MYIERYNVRDDIFTKILAVLQPMVKKVDDILPYCNKGAFKYNKEVVIYNGNDKLICRKSYLYHFMDLKFDDDYYKMVLCERTSESTSDLYTSKPYANTAVKFMKKILFKYYTEEEYIQCLDSHTVNTHIIPIHINPSFDYEYNKIYRLTDCAYYDINNAHLDALTEIFPKAAEELINLRKKINYLKKIGKKDKAQRYKDLVNIYVGELGNNQHPRFKATNEWIVNRTKNKLQSLIDKVGGSIVYANTDGVIIKDPINRIKTSNKLGDFKDELKDGVIYLLLHKGKTSYTLYQYYNGKKFEKKGSALNSVREQIDLSKGIYVDYDRVKVEGGWKADNLEILKGEVYEY